MGGCGVCFGGAGAGCCRDGGVGAGGVGVGTLRPGIVGGLPNCGGGLAAHGLWVNDLNPVCEDRVDLQGPDPAGFSFGMPPAKRPPS